MDKPKESGENFVAAASADADAATPMPAIVWSAAPNIEPANTAPPKIETAEIVTAGIDASKVEAGKLDEIDPVVAVKVAPAPAEPAAVAATAAAPGTALPGRRNFALLAASMALSAAFGAVAGALGGAGLARPDPSPAGLSTAATAATSAAAEESRALQITVAELRTELAALKVSVEAGTRTSATQFTKFGERFDRIERAQGEPAAKVAKAIEALERLERRVDLGLAKETTGSAPPPHPAAATPAPPPLPPQPPFVEGWVVRDVYRGVAIIQGRRLGMIEVESGDVVPGVGRIESIRKLDGRWVVVTSKGLITSRR